MAEQEGDLAAPAKSGKGKKVITAVVVILIMGLEAGGIVVAMKLMGSGGPQAAEAGEALAEAETEEDAPPAHEEVLVAKVRATHTKTGQVYLYTVTVYAIVAADKADQAKALLETRKATVEDRICQVVRSALPQQLKEDGLETLRRQIKFELQQVADGQEYFEEILIPELIPHRADY